MGNSMGLFMTIYSWRCSEYPGRWWKWYNESLIFILYINTIYRVTSTSLLYKYLNVWAKIRLKLHASH